MNLQEALQVIVGRAQVRREGENEKVTQEKHILLRQKGENEMATKKKISQKAVSSKDDEYKQPLTMSSTCRFRRISQSGPVRAGGSCDCEKRVLDGRESHAEPFFLRDDVCGA